ncbi:MAG: ABC transporter ATP-binding protein [Sphingomonas sp.]|jgi:ATP-binding cassette subfamily C protein|uniref:ATP-binding cassette domain-containing protein n=1 Tax=Sphingomonas sp. TaxID=28214 RepID=UPI003568182B
MPTIPRPSAIKPLLRATRAFFGSFARYAGHKGWLAGGLVGLAAILDGAGLLLLIPIIDAVVATPGKPSRTAALLDAAGAHTPLARLAVMLASFVALSLVRAVVLYARDMALARLQTGFVENLRNRLMRRLAAASWHRVVALRHARITSLMTSEVARISGSAQYLIQGSVAVVMLLVQGVLAFALAPLLALATALLVLFGALIALLAQGRIRDLGAGMVGANMALMGSTSGFLGGLKAAAAQNAQSAFVDEFETIQGEVRQRSLSFSQRQASSRRIFAIGSALMGATVITIGFATGVPPAVLITIVVIFARMSAPAQTLQIAAQNFFFALPAFEAVQAFEAELGAGESASDIVTAPPAGAIELRGVTYLHAGGGGVKDISFVIAPGCFTGIAGPSGAGKTTLVDLLITLLIPQSGEIRVGDTALLGEHATGWRDALAYVPQEGFLFHDSVRRNLTWGTRGLDEAALWQALDFVGAEPLVRALPEGLDTVVGERGARLSGGERQRLAIARALLRRPRLLVLDEATNAIDAASEAALLDRLAALAPRPTIVMISHRAETMAYCDTVITIERGTIVPR